MNQIHWVNKERFLEKSDRKVGAILGVDIPLTENTWLNIEQQLGDYTALGVGVNIRF